MAQASGHASLDALVSAAVPALIRRSDSMCLPEPLGETAALARLRTIAAKNQVFKSYIGLGYYDTITPPVIQRNILENPGWYTQYTPYQAEISQGRLEGLLNFQTMVCDLTGLDISNASLLDEATACAEAMTLCRRVKESDAERNTFWIASDCHPQNIDLVRTRAEALGLQVVVGDWKQPSFGDEVFGVLVQYPGTSGEVGDYSTLVQKAHEAGALVVFAADLLALTLFKTPGEWGVGRSEICSRPPKCFGVHRSTLYMYYL